MATTQTILVSGTYNGTHAGGPFSVPHGTSQIQLNFNVTDAPAGANFTFEADTSSDGGVAWQRNPDGSGSSIGPFDDCGRGHEIPQPRRTLGGPSRTGVLLMMTAEA